MTPDLTICYALNCNMAIFKSHEEYTIDFIIPGVPVAQARPRFTSNGTRVYEPKQCTEYKRLIQCIVKRCQFNLLLDPLEPIICRLIFAFPFPKSTTKKEIARAKHEIVFKNSRPDVDNLEKAVMDALNGILWYDDKQVVSLSSAKIYSPYEPFTMVSVRHAETLTMEETGEQKYDD